MSGPTTGITDMASLIAQIRTELTDTVQQMAGLDASAVAGAIKGRSEMLEAMALAFIAETGVPAGDAILYERYDPATRTWSWWFEQRGDETRVIEALRLKLQEAIDLLDGATGKTHVYLNQINALGGDFAKDLQRVSLSTAGPIMDADVADAVTGAISKGVRDDLAGESTGPIRTDQPAAGPGPDEPEPERRDPA